MRPISIEQLRTFIVGSELDRVEIARIAGVDPTALSRWLTGARRPQPQNLMRVQRAALAVWRTRAMRNAAALHELLAAALREEDENE